MARGAAAELEELARRVERGDVSALRMLDAKIAEFDDLESRSSLLGFARRVYPGFQEPPHIRALARILERVESGELKRVSVSIPVRSGKSVLCSQIFPAWFIGRNPRRSVILSSHSESLSIEHSVVARNIVDDVDSWPWPELRLAKDSASVQRWKVEPGRGGLYAVGVGGGITGRGADLLLIDDALHDAESANEREKAWNWFTRVAIPRLEPGGAIILVNARFAVDDLPGRVRDSEDAAEWTFFDFPAIAVEDDILGRKPGEALWPERMSLKELMGRRLSMGSFAFEAQFQQNPVPEGGVIFHSEWFNRRWTPATLPNDWVMKVMTIDSAWKDGPQNDYAVFASWGFDGVDYYLLDVFRKKMEYPELERTTIAKFEEQRPQGVIVEEAQSGIAVLQQLKSNTRLPVVPWKVIGSKEARAQAVTPWFEAGRVVIPEKGMFPWLDPWLAEHLRFPATRHDDQVDTTTMAVDYLSRLVVSDEIDYDDFQGFMER